MQWNATLRLPLCYIGYIWHVYFNEYNSSMYVNKIWFHESIPFLALSATRMTCYPCLTTWYLRSTTIINAFNIINWSVANFSRLNWSRTWFSVMLQLEIRVDLAILIVIRSSRRFIRYLIVPIFSAATRWRQFLSYS